MKVKIGRANAMLLLSLVGVAILAVGCLPSGKSGVTVLLAGDVGSKSLALDSKAPKNGDVNVADILSLKVTVTEISLDYAGALQPSGEGEGEGGGEGEGEGEKVVIFSGAKEIDILNLIGVSELISSADVQPGFYTKVRLAISNPKLVLVSNPNTEITDIQLTANGHLFVSESFELPIDQKTLILLDFSGIHLVQTGNGKFVWTPQLRATIEVESAEAQITGTIESVDPASNTMAVAVAGSGDIVDVYLSGAVDAIFLPTDVDAPTGTPADLVVGARVQIVGLLTVLGDLNAGTIVILPPDAP